MKRLKKDDNGFTLVELIIAIVILAIVISPLFQNFIQSTKLNKKARITMNATNMASNIMEGMTAYSAQKVILGFDGVDSRGKLQFLPDNITCNSYGEVRATGSPATFAVDYTIEAGVATGAPQYVDGSTLSANSLKLIPSSDKKYYLFAEGVQQNNTTYDILVKLDASSDSGYSGDVDKDGQIDATELEKYNDYEGITVHSQNALVDCSHKDNSTLFDEIKAKFESDSNKNQYASNLNVDELKRQLVVEINCVYDDPFKTNIIGYEVYTYNVFTTSQWGFDNITIETSRSLIYESNKFIPRDIYINYLPNYGSKNSGDDARDKIVIKNNDGVDIDVHLLRISDKNLTNLENLEDSYRCNLYIEDAGYPTDIHTKVYSNLRDNLAKNVADNETYRSNYQRCGLKMCNNVNKAPNPVYIPIDASNTIYKQVVEDNGGIEVSKSDRLYSVIVEVYEAGAAASGFPEDLKVATYDGGSKQ